MRFVTGESQTPMPLVRHTLRFSSSPDSLLGGNAGVETCGADASASFNRDDFGVDFGLGRHLQYVNLMIMVEANRAE